jgi:hypothetical protein
MQFREQSPTIAGNEDHRPRHLCPHVLRAYVNGGIVSDGVAGRALLIAPASVDARESARCLGEHDAGGTADFRVVAESAGHDRQVLGR